MNKKERMNILLFHEIILLSVWFWIVLYLGDFEKRRRSKFLLKH